MKTVAQALKDVDHYLENAQYVLAGQKQLNVKETQHLREQLNRAKNQLQSAKELYTKEQTS
jgi:hypothetical protein